MRTVLRIALTVVMNALLVVAALLLGRVVIEFFSQASAVPGATEIARLSDVFVLPVGLTSIPTPYRGVFDVAAVVTLMAVLAAEWVVALVRRRFAR